MEFTIQAQKISPRKMQLNYGSQNDQAFSEAYRTHTFMNRMVSIPEFESLGDVRVFQDPENPEDNIKRFIPHVHDPIFDDAPLDSSPVESHDWLFGEPRASLGTHESDSVAPGDHVPDIRLISCVTETFRVIRKKSLLGGLSVALHSCTGERLVVAVSERFRSSGSYFRVQSNSYGYLGKIRSSRLGSNYWFHDGATGCHSCIVQFESRITGAREKLGPCRRMVVTLDSPGSDNPTVGIKRQASGATCDSFDIFSDFGNSSALKLTSTEPTRTPAGYVLDFGSESVIPSVKNCVLSDFSGMPKLTMCKIGRNEFELKVAEGICPLAAFVVAVSSIDKKLCTQ